MATLVLVGSRDAAVEAALQLGHQVVLLSDRKALKRRRGQLLAAIETDLAVSNGHQLVRHCVEEMRAVAADLPTRIDAVIGVTERAVLPAAWLRAHLNLSGNSQDSAYLCRNKLAMKQAVIAAGLPCSEFASVTRRSTAASLIQRLGLPLVIKPVDSSGARGTIIAQQQRDVAKALSPGMVAESFNHGIEMSIESFVMDGKIQFVNLTEYLVPLWSNVVPATIIDPIKTQLLDLNRQVVNTLGITRGMTHMEIFLTVAGPVFSEVALRPPGGYLMELIEQAYGFNPWHALLQIELGNPVEFPTQALQHAGMLLLHPGEGVVKRVEGLAQARRVPGVTEATSRVRPGELLTRREGSGESAAHIVAAAPTRTEVVTALTRARQAVLIELHAKATSHRARSSNGKVQPNEPVIKSRSLRDPAKSVPERTRRESR